MTWTILYCNYRCSRYRHRCPLFPWLMPASPQSNDCVKNFNIWNDQVKVTNKQTTSTFDQQASRPSCSGRRSFLDQPKHPMKEVFFNWRLNADLIILWHRRRSILLPRWDTPTRARRTVFVIAFTPSLTPLPWMWHVFVSQDFSSQRSFSYWPSLFGYFAKGMVSRVGSGECLSCCLGTVERCWCNIAPQLWRWKHGAKWRLAGLPDRCAHVHCRKCHVPRMAIATDNRKVSRTAWEAGRIRKNNRQRSKLS